MNNKNSTQNVSIISDCISQSIGIEMPTVSLIGEYPLPFVAGHFLSCMIRNGGKHLIDTYMFKQTEHPYLFKISSTMLGCVGGAIKYVLAKSHLASIPEFLPALIIIGCINNASYEFVSDLDKQYATPIPIEVLEIFIKSILSDKNMKLQNNDIKLDDEILKGQYIGFLVFFFGQTSYPTVHESFFKETEDIYCKNNLLSCIQHPMTCVTYGTKIENASTCSTDVIKIADYYSADFEDN